ncbi:glycosyltransferase [Lactobacillus sp. PFC-70]|nr:glycosyltransferase [Lactobacillus sp. PFC-70]
MNNLSITAIVVTYNRLNLLKECIDALKKQTRVVDRILIINNNSTDGTTNFLKSLHDESIVVCNLAKNIGGAAGFSYGVEKAFSLGTDYIWIMDDDTIPDPCALEAMADKAKELKDDFGFLCSNVRWKDGSATNIPSVGSAWPDKSLKQLIQVETATFVSVLVSTKVVKRVGIPTAKLFIWGDDTEYTTRISTKYTCYFVINSTVLHKSKTNLSNTTIVNDTDKNRLKRYFYMYRNLIYIARRYHGSKDITKTALSALSYAIKALLFSKNYRFRRFLIVLKGIFSGFLFNPKVVYPD